MNRMARIKRMPCVACGIRFCYQPNPTEVHHLNSYGKAGQKRRGDRYTIPLCQWHHRGEPARGLTKTYMTAIYGPSLARHSKAFREHYGTDDELLAKTDAMLAKQAAA